MTFDDDLDRDDPHDAIDVLADTSEVERAARRARPSRVPEPLRRECQLTLTT